MPPSQALLDHAVGEACAHVQGESLKAHAALLRRLINSPITSLGGQNMSSNSTERYGGKIFAAIVILLVAGVIFSKTDYGFGLAQPGMLANQNSAQAGYADPSSVFGRVSAGDPNLLRSGTADGKDRLAPQDAASGQDGDPYAAGQRELASREYAKLKQIAMNQIAMAGWAYKCNVISEFDATRIQLTAPRIFLGPNGVNTTDPGLGAEIARAGRTGFNLAAERGCDYWQTNPGAVSEMRAQAGSAIP